MRTPSEECKLLAHFTGYGLDRGFPCLCADLFKRGGRFATVHDAWFLGRDGLTPGFLGEMALKLLEETCIYNTTISIKITNT